MIENYSRSMFLRWQYFLDLPLDDNVIHVWRSERRTTGKCFNTEQLCFTWKRMINTFGTYHDPLSKLRSYSRFIFLPSSALAEIVSDPLQMGDYNCMCST